MKWVKTFAIMAVLVTIVAGCGGGGGGNTPAEGAQSPVSIRYTNGAMATEAMGITGETNIPILMYGVIVRAYQYGPRPTMIGERSNATWSSWRLIPFEIFYLSNGGVADLTPDYTEITPDYVANVGTFSFDFLVAQGEPSPVNANNSVCGANSVEIYEGQAEQYPDLNFGVCQHTNVVSSVDGKDMFLLRAIFARRDWFPATLQVYLGADPDAIEGLQCYETSTPLSTFQEEILTSLLNLELDGSYTNPIVYNPYCTTEVDGQGRSRSPVDLPITIIPQTGDLAVAQLSQEAVPQPPLVTEGGETIPQPDLVVTSSSLRAEVGFDLVPGMVVNYDLFNIDSDPSDIILNPGINGAPWGMTLNFVATP